MTLVVKLVDKIDCEGSEESEGKNKISGKCSVGGNHPGKETVDR